MTILYVREEMLVLVKKKQSPKIFFFSFLFYGLGCDVDLISFVFENDVTMLVYYNQMIVGHKAYEFTFGSWIMKAMNTRWGISFAL